MEPENKTTRVLGPKWIISYQCGGMRVYKVSQQVVSEPGLGTLAKGSLHHFVQHAPTQLSLKPTLVPLVGKPYGSIPLQWYDIV